MSISMKPPKLTVHYWSASFASPGLVVLLLDTDAFCVLGLTDLLAQAAELLGQSFEDYRRLPALPHMLKRGRLRERWGEEACDRLRPIAAAIAVVPDGDVDILGRLAAIHEIDPG